MTYAINSLVCSLRFFPYTSSDFTAEQEITGDVLLDLDINLLKTEIGIMAFGKRMRIANAITDLRRPPSIVYSDHQPSPTNTNAQAHLSLTPSQSVSQVQTRTHSRSQSHQSFPSPGGGGGGQGQQGHPSSQRSSLGNQQVVYANQNGNGYGFGGNGFSGNGFGGMPENENESPGTDYIMPDSDQYQQPQQSPLGLGIGLPSAFAMNGKGSVRFSGMVISVV